MTDQVTWRDFLEVGKNAFYFIESQNLPYLSWLDPIFFTIFLSNQILELQILLPANLSGEFLNPLGCRGRLDE